MRRYGNPKRTNRDKQAALYARHEFTKCGRGIPVTIDEWLRAGVKRTEAEKLVAEVMR